MTLQRGLTSVSDWRDHLTPDERQWLAEYERRKAADRKEARKIFDRARKRAQREAIEQGARHD